MLRLHRLLVILLLLGLAPLVRPVAALAESAGIEAPGVPDGILCARATARMEQAGYVPPQLLTAISHVESGRWDPILKAKIAWPWTVNANGVGRFFPTKQDAIAEVLRLQQQGVVLIDVGCMQINLHFHAGAFPNLETAFDPNANVTYAVSFLRDLAVSTGSWMRAAARYHSATPDLASIYHAKVVAELREMAGSPVVPAAQYPNLQFAAVVAPRAGAFSPGSVTPTGIAPPLGSMPQTAVSPIAPTTGNSPMVMPDPAAAEQRDLQAEIASEAHDRDTAAARSFADAWRARQLSAYLHRKNVNVGATNASSPS